MPEVFLSLGDGILNTAKRREKPLVPAFENLTSMPRLIDIEKTSNLMRDVTYQSAPWVPTVHSSYLLDVKFDNKNSNFTFGCQIPKLDFGGRIQKTVEPTELFLPSKPRFPGLCSVSIMTIGHGK